MCEDFKVVAFDLTTNMDVKLHEQEELELLVKKKIINKDIVEYNKKLSNYLSQFKQEDSLGEEVKSKCKKFKKELEKIGQLNKIDRISILNNHFANEAELLLKVPNCENITPKQRKIILQGQL